ncbi:hypothetical protein [uncultured Enterovirga sp.]|uniref:hypothetical protein n=1 Tax=uncultured Enterovirga sp. TaxID=2026352 RepID=UPI0035CC70DE
MQEARHGVEDRILAIPGSIVGAQREVAARPLTNTALAEPVQAGSSGSGCRHPMLR